MRRTCDLDDLVRQTIELLSSDPLAWGVGIDIAAGGLQAEVDPDQVRQLLLNLLRNALAAAGKGGRVRTFFSQVDGQVQIHGPYAQIAVSDNGGGMDEATQARLFEPFFTTKGVGRGTGLGLSTVHSIVRAHGGQIQVSSSPGEGTEFVVGFAAPSGEVQRA